MEAAIAPAPEFHEGPHPQETHAVKKRVCTRHALFFYMAGGPGFEPGLAESESAVLPLDDPPEVNGSDPFPV